MYKKESIADLSIKIDLRTDWEKLFDILQVLNTESDKCMLHTNVTKNVERWEDICYYMSVIKPEEEE